MNLFDSFSNFYGGLSSDGLFFFWVVAFLFCFLLFLAIILFIKNRKLNKLLNDEESTIPDEIIVKSDILSFGFI